MIEVKKIYCLNEIIITVNKREILYEPLMSRAVYAYNGINKEEFGLSYSKWSKLCKMHKLQRVITK